jgi:hypothetical protein
LEQKLSIAKGKLQDAEKDLNVLTKQRDKARQKLESLKNHQMFKVCFAVFSSGT